MAATTRTSTPKSLSFFSIMRLVISSVSGDTLSRCCCAASSKSTCGSRLSGRSVNKGFCRSFTTRVLCGTSTSTGSMICTGTGWCASMSVRSPVTTASRARAARRPSARSIATSRRARRDCSKASMRAPSPSAKGPQEKRSTHAAPSTTSTIPKRPDPVKPSQRMASGPITWPTTPPASPGRSGSKRYKRVHSSMQLAAINKARPPQKTARSRVGRRAGAPSAGAPPRSRRASDEIQARTPAARHHQTEKPKAK